MALSGLLELRIFPVGVYENEVRFPKGSTRADVLELESNMFDDRAPEGVTTTDV